MWVLQVQTLTRGRVSSYPLTSVRSPSLPEEAAGRVQDTASSQEPWQPLGASPSGLLGHQHGQAGAETDRGPAGGRDALQPQAGDGPQEEAL